MEKQVTEILTRFSGKQKQTWLLCPRCGMDMMSPILEHNALSRRADLMICNLCGNIEGIEDMPTAGITKLPIEKWELVEHPERYFLKGKDFFNYCFTFAATEDHPFQNAYVMVEAFDQQLAAAMLGQQFPDRIPQTFKDTFGYTEEIWLRKESSTNLICAGVIHLSGRFERCE